MTPPDRLKDLQAIVELLRDRDLARLAAAARTKQQTEGLLCALDRTQSTPVAQPEVFAQVSERFDLWTTSRRIALNHQLARDTARWLDAKAQAQITFGRAVALKRQQNRR